MVPITSDLDGYQRFWTFWMRVVAVLGVTYATAILAVLIAIWRRLA